MNVLRIHDGCTEPIEIENTLEALQAAVGGYIEVVPLTARLCVICNEEGKLLGLPVTAALVGDIGQLYDTLHGDLIVCRTTEDGEFTDVRPDDLTAVGLYLRVVKREGVTRCQ